MNAVETVVDENAFFFPKVEIRHQPYEGQRQKKSSPVLCVDGAFLIASGQIMFVFVLGKKRRDAVWLGLRWCFLVCLRVCVCFHNLFFGLFFLDVSVSFMYFFPRFFLPFFFFFSRVSLWVCVCVSNDLLVALFTFQNFLPKIRKKK